MNHHSLSLLHTKRLFFQINHYSGSPVTSPLALVTTLSLETCKTPFASGNVAIKIKRGVMRQSCAKLDRFSNMYDNYRNTNEAKKIIILKKSKSESGKGSQNDHSVTRCPRLQRESKPGTHTQLSLCVHS